jgi:hypothetical protein
MPVEGILLTPHSDALLSQALGLVQAEGRGKNIDSTSTATSNLQDVENYGHQSFTLLRITGRPKLDDFCITFPDPQYAINALLNIL